MSNRDRGGTVHARHALHPQCPGTGTVTRMCRDALEAQSPCGNSRGTVTVTEVKRTIDGSY